jgi:hypothetical protein
LRFFARSSFAPFALKENLTAKRKRTKKCIELLACLSRLRGLLRVQAAGQARGRVLGSLHIKQAGINCSLVFSFAFLSTHRIKDASPQLRLTQALLLEPEVESWERMDSRAVALKAWKFYGQETRSR